MNILIPLINRFIHCVELEMKLLPLSAKLLLLSHEEEYVINSGLITSLFASSWVENLTKLKKHKDRSMTENVKVEIVQAGNKHRMRYQ